jgi:hypothetical protein
LFYLQGSLKLNEYIQQLKRDDNLLVYIPEFENYSFIIKKCNKVN